MFVLCPFLLRIPFGFVMGALTVIIKWTNYINLVHLC